MNVENLLFLSYEPWETRIATEVLTLADEAGEIGKATMLIADPYQIRTNDGVTRLQKLVQNPHFSMEVAFQELLDWQEKINKARKPEVEHLLAQLEADSGVSQLGELIASDLHLVPRERAPYYRPMTRTQALMAAALVFQRVLTIYRDVQPSLVAMIDEQYLVKNFVARLAAVDGTPIRVMRMARYQGFVKCDDFFLPEMPVGQKNRKEPAKATSASDPTDFGSSLYEKNLSVSGKKTIRDLRQKKIPSTLKIFREGIRKQRKKKKAGRGSRPEEYRRPLYWSSSVWRVHVYLLLQSFRMLRYVWLSYPYSPAEKITGPYVVVPLHVRPESGTLTKGPGLEDEDVAQAVAKIIGALKLNMTCVVLEHPSMIQDRRFRFYTKLLRSPHVLIADPALETVTLLREASAIVTIAGTAALEASLLGVPVHVMGQPEFLPAIASTGPERLEKFLQEVAAGEAPDSRDAVVDYLRGIESRGVKMPWGWEAVSSPENVETATNGILGLMRNSLDA